MPGEPMPQEAFDILKNSGILNPNVTLGQMMETGKQLSATVPIPNVATFFGPWYCYTKD